MRRRLAERTRLPIGLGDDQAMYTIADPGLVQQVRSYSRPVHGCFQFGYLNAGLPHGRFGGGELSGRSRNLCADQSSSEDLGVGD